MLARSEALLAVQPPNEGFANSAEPARLRDCHNPALDFQDYIEDLDRLRASGRVAGRGLRTRIYMASVLHAHRTTQLRAGRAERLIDAVLATIGRVVVS